MLSWFTVVCALATCNSSWLSRSISSCRCDGRTTSGCGSSIEQHPAHAAGPGAPPAMAWRPPQWLLVPPLQAASSTSAGGLACRQADARSGNRHRPADTAPVPRPLRPLEGGTDRRSSAALAAVRGHYVTASPGVGKSHLVCALGHALVDAGRRVLFARCSEIVQRLQAARQELRLPQELAKLDRFDLLILDDLSYVRRVRTHRRALRAQEPCRDGEHALLAVGCTWLIMLMP